MLRAPSGVAGQRIALMMRVECGWRVPSRLRAVRELGERGDGASEPDTTVMADWAE